MAITRHEAQEQILADLGTSIDHLALALACLGEAYELLSVMAADRLEPALYLPVQKAFGRAKRTHSQFAERIGFESRAFETPAAGRTSQGVKSFVERGVVAAAEGDQALAELQDSMLPIESGDAELRAGLTETRDLLAGLPNASREFLRTLGR